MFIELYELEILWENLLLFDMLKGDFWDDDCSWLELEPMFDIDKSNFLYDYDFIKALLSNPSNVSSEC